MKKILFVLSSEKLSGGEKVALEIAKNLKDKFVFLFYLPNKPQNELLALLKDFKLYFPQKDCFLKIVCDLSEIIKNEKPEIVHAHGIRAGVYVKITLLFKRKNFKFIYTLHGAHFLHYKFLQKLIFLVWEFFSNRLFVDILTCVGIDDYEAIKKLNLINLNKLVLIQNGINIDDYQNIEGGKLRQELNLKDEIICTTICRLHYQKDLETLIKAINLIKNENLILLIVGDGEDKKRLENLANELGLEKRIKFLGFRNDIKKILKDSDLFILSSRWEGLPVVILEAWAMRKPIIVSAVHGIKSLVQDKMNGLLFKLGDEKDLAEKIKELIKDQNLRLKLANGGFKTVSEKYNLNLMVDNYQNLYLRNEKNL